VSVKIKEIRTMPEDEVNGEIEKARAKIFKVRFQAKGENVENPGSLKTLRRHVARMKTVLREREISKAAKTATAPAEAGAAAKGGEA
jgi:large subunit ribosomal protein L29